MSTRLGAHIISTPSLAAAFGDTQGHAAPSSAFDPKSQSVHLACPRDEVVAFVALPIARLCGTKASSPANARPEHAFNIYGVVGVNAKQSVYLRNSDHVIHSTLIGTRAAVELCNTQEADKTRGALSDLWTVAPIAEPVRMAVTLAHHGHGPAAHRG